jgi:alkylation response protein AidB-like acyl-CoA dehydrogenase
MVISVLRGMHAAGELAALPLPGHGQTRARWSGLAEWGRSDLVLARLAEGHVDALAILAEAGLAADPDALYGVWAARPGGVCPRLDDAGRCARVDGTARFCSGADLLDRALLVVDQDNTAPVLVEVSLADPGVRPDAGAWRAAAMAESHTWDVEFHAVPVDRAVGTPGWYTDRPGFAAGGGGVAAIWWGAACGLLARAYEHARTRGADAHRRAHLGELHALLTACRALVDSTAEAIDQDAGADHRIAVATLRNAVEHSCREVLDRLPRAVGPAGWSRDERFASQLSDLQMYLRQHHGERDHAELASALLARTAR